MINQIFMRRMGRGVAGLLLLIALCAAMASAATPRVKWRRLSPAHKPSARVNMVMAYDPVGQNIVMFGGFDGTSYLNDTWIFNGTDWVQLSPANAPPVRSATAISFDRVTNTLVLFGGFNGTQYLGDTWLWDGAVQNWTEAHPTTLPTAVTLPMMYTDPISGHTGMVGGFDGNLFHNETWQWTGSDWLELFPQTVLWARGAAVVANDDANGTVMIFGGLADLNPNNTWTWDGVNWTELAPTRQPPAVYYTPAAYDAALGQVVMFGGMSSQSGSWAWTGTNWISLPAYTPPPLLNAQGMAYDQQSKQLIMFGGSIQSLIVNDTYLLLK